MSPNIGEDFQIINGGVKAGVRQDGGGRRNGGGAGKHRKSIKNKKGFLFTTVEYTFLYKQPTTTRVCKCLPEPVRFLQHHDDHHDHP